MLGRKNLFLIVLFALFSQGVAEAACTVSCPAGWGCPPDGSNICSPNLPSSDFFHHTADINYQRPICGTELGTGRARIPVLPSFEPLEISTSTYPKSSIVYAADNLPGTKSVTDSTYLYDSLTRCVCMNAVVAASPSPSPSTDTTKLPGGNYPTGYTRIYPDTYDVISTQNQNASVNYNMVAYSNDVSKDGRDGSIYSAVTGTRSRCGCPNMNEEPVTNSTSGSGIVGVHCMPLIRNSDTVGAAPPAGRILTTYNANYHGGQLINSTEEAVDGTIITQMMIPTSSGGSQLYDRKIWTCAPPYKLNAGTRTCDPPTMSDHACSAGTDAASASPVSSDLTGSDPMTKFNNTINKKLACCLNDRGKDADVGSFIKFDCVENSTTTYNTFDDLWKSSDDGVDGGQSNAMVLAGPLGKYLTGFYTIDGVRCDAYSEFAATYKPQRLKKVNNAWVNSDVPGLINGDIVPPTSFSSLFSSKSVPSTPDEMRRCPILARAAMVVTCPPKTELPVVLKTYSENSGKIHCSAAASVQVHVRIEQIFEIEGQPKMKTVDTVAEKRLASSISVEKIIANKSGNSCPGGSSKQGDACVY